MRNPDGQMEKKKKNAMKRATAAAGGGVKDKKSCSGQPFVYEAARTPSSYTSNK